MEITDITKMARELGVNAKGNKVKLIRRIQKAEGREPCFKTRRECDQVRCMWCQECLSEDEAVKYKRELPHPSPFIVAPNISVFGE